MADYRLMVIAGTFCFTLAGAQYNAGSWANYFPVPSASSQTTHGGTYWRGSTRLRNHSMTIDIEAGYLDVTEDVEIGPVAYAGWNSTPNGDLNTLEIQGSFNLPSGAAVTGLLIWEGDTILKGKLKPAETATRQYEEVVDRNSSPPVRPRDPFFVEQAGYGVGWDIYRFHVYPVIWDEYRKLRIRYLLPRQQPAHASGLFAPQPLFRGSSVPERIHCILKSGFGFKRVALGADTAAVAYDLPAELDLDFDYAAPFEFRTTPDIPAYWLETSIPDGEWQGHYLQIRSPIPREAMDDAGLIRETVFLWKWNHPEAYFDEHDGNMVATDWGTKVKFQAQRILQAADVVWENQGEAGLVLHIGDRHRPDVFGMGAKGSAQARRMKEVLSSIVSDDYWHSLASQLHQPNDPELNRPTIAENGLIGFHLAVQAAYSMFSRSGKRLRTLIFITAGPHYPGDDPIGDVPDSIFAGGIGLSSLPNAGNTLEWPGVNLPRILNSSEHRLRNPDPSTGLPLLGITGGRIICSAGSNELFRDFDLAGFGSTPFLPLLEFAGHSQDAWSPEMRLELHTANGQSFVSTQRFEVLNIPNDTGWAKLWAKSPIRKSTRFPETDLGAIFGFVDPSNSLLALESDTLPAKYASEIRAGGVPYLQPDEIFLPVPEDQAIAIRARERFAGVHPFWRDGWIEFRLPRFGKARLRIVDLRGRLISAEYLRPGLENYRIRMPAWVGAGTVILMLEMDGKAEKFMLTQAGAR